MKFPKHQYIRSPKLLRLVASLRCQNCESEDGVQAAHSNWGGGKGRGIKADDNQIAALCQRCHHDVDQGHKLTKAQRQEIWNRAHVRTLHILQLTGQWPKEIPFTDQYLRIDGSGADA